MSNNYGYYFHPSSHPQGIGHPQLDINIYNEPTNAHFDPHEVVVWAIEKSRRAVRVTIRHPWPKSPDTLRLGVERIIIHDRLGKTLEAYAFGGMLQITTHETHTHCEVTSASPIMALTGDQTVEMLVISEFEALIARKRAAWDDPDVFRVKLAAIEPMTLLSAGIVAIEAHLHQLPVTISQQKSLHALNETIRVLKEEGRFVADTPSFDQLL